MALQNEVDLYREFLIQRGWPDNLISSECAYIAQQPKGTATEIMEATAIVLEYLDDRRKE